MCVGETNDLWIASFPEIRKRLFIRCYRKILVKLSTYPDPLQWELLLEHRTTTESLRTFLLQDCNYRGTLSYTPKSEVTQLSSNP